MRKFTIFAFLLLLSCVFTAYGDENTLRRDIILLRQTKAEKTIFSLHSTSVQKKLGAKLDKTKFSAYSSHRQAEIASKQAAGDYVTALTGDVTATGPGSAATTVAKIHGKTVDSTAPASGDFFRYNGTSWLHVPLSSGDIPNNAANTTGSAAKLTTSRTINGVGFDGTENITINAVDATAREPAIAAGTASQYWRGDKSWQTLGALATLALGSANAKLFTNAAGIAPEWGTGVKTAYFSRAMTAASGTQAVTGVGFKPSMVVFLGTIDATVSRSYGIDDGGGVNANAIYYQNATASGINAGQSISLYVSAGVMYSGRIQSMDADGFTINWTRTGGPTGTAYIIYLAIR